MFLPSASIMAQSRSMAYSREEQLTEIDLLIQSADYAHAMRNPEDSDGKLSPSSVISLPSPSASDYGNKKRIRKHSLCSTVLVGEEGAELLLEDLDNLSLASSPLSCLTPNKALKSCPTYSLLDDAESAYTTPTPPKKATVATRNSVETDLCCTGYLLGCLQHEESEDRQMVLLQRKLNKFLSDPMQLGSLCNEWQVFSLAAAGEQKHGKALNGGDIKQVLRNRAFNIAERRRRMDTVRKDLSPFNGTPIRQRRSPAKLGTVRSFDIAQHAPAIVRGSKDTIKPAVFSIWQTACFCNPTEAGRSPAVIDSQVLESVYEDTCYDSDPETFIRKSSRRIFTPTRCRSALAPFNFGTASDDNKENFGAPNNLPTSSPQRQQADYTDDYYVRQVVQGFMNEHFTLILHIKSPTAHSFSPHAIRAWFERGQHLSCNSVIQPRFVWQSVHCTKSSHSSLAVPKSAMTGFDLIDVSRILSVDKVDREQNPFAKASHCFLIKTMDESLLFETKSKSDKERVVRLFKLLVARLGSQLIVGDQSFFDEYFVSSSDIGAGDAPYWLSNMD